MTASAWDAADAARIEAERVLGSDRVRLVERRVLNRLTELLPDTSADIWREETAREVSRG